jgi:hypothetical protein
MLIKASEQSQKYAVPQIATSAIQYLINSYTIMLYTLGKIKEFLDLVWSLVEREEDACLLFFDELSEMAGQMPEALCKRFRKIMTNKFQVFV